MNIGRLKLVYFSPTGTTRSVVTGIARGLSPSSIEHIDITLPEARTHALQAAEDDLLVIGVPVYMGRVPALITDWLKAIRTRDAPAVCVVVYGNRTYEDALLELRNIVTTCGCIPVAGAAFIGEHSFSDAASPTARGRPDSDDLRLAEQCGVEIRKNLVAVPEGSHVPEVSIPGMFPYRGDPRLWSLDCIAVSDACTQCGICAKFCPAGAIDPEKSRWIDTKRCITCCACLKRCPARARSIKPGLLKDAQLRLHTLYAERKEPEWFV